MTKRGVVLMMIAATLASCSRSEFSVTSRTKVKGKTVYANRHPREARLAAVKLKPAPCLQPAVEVPEPVPAPVPEPISELIRAETGLDRVDGRTLPGHGLLLASASGDAAITPLTVVVKAGYSTGDPGEANRVSASAGDTLADSTRILAPRRGTTMDLSARYVIHLVNGKKLKSGAIFQSHDTLFYQDRNDPNLLRFVDVEQVNNIIREVPGDEYPESGDGPRTDPLAVLALAFTILGWVPVLGIPFAIMALIFGLVSLGKNRRNPEKFKGRNTAIVALVLWAAGLLVYIVLVAMGTFAM